jgi:hypothetical protein
LATADEILERLGRARYDAAELVQAKGVRATRHMLSRAEHELAARLKQAEGLSGPGKASFTAGQLRSTLAQVQAVTRSLTRDMRGTILDHGREAARAAGKNTVQHIVDAETFFKGTSEPLAIKEAGMLDEAVQGTEASLLRRLAVTDQDPGVLGRYGVNTIAKFESELQQSVMTKRPWDDVRASLIAQSPFLQGAPAHWAERIVRTELAGAYNRAGWEAVREADAQLGDMCKIISEHFDDRTGADSFAVHGQIRRPEEAFEWWDGLYQHPPNRPNDRAAVVPHRVSWPIPPALAWRAAGEIARRWRAQGHRGPVPDRPRMTSIPLSQFGRPLAARARA